MNNNVQKNWKSLIICFLTFALLAASAYYYINSQSNEVRNTVKLSVSLKIMKFNPLKLI